MALVLHVDAPRWREHLARTVAAMPGVVPVVKGEGYGFGQSLVLTECAGLPGVDLVAVGTYAELPESLEAYPGDILCLEPYVEAVMDQAPPDVLGAAADPRVVHTVASPADLAGLLERCPNAQVVIEGLTSMRRFGAGPQTVGALLRTLSGDGTPGRLLGATLHLPLGSGHIAQVEQWIADAPQVGTWLVSHLSTAELDRLRAAHPDLVFRPRVGTALWLGDPDAYRVTGHVLAVQDAPKGTVAGYRGRPVRGAQVAVVSGGTAHGVGMAAPTSGASTRLRAIALAEGALNAAGRVRSPFEIAGTPTWFVEPPHMQCSLIAVADGSPVPQVGDELAVRMRLTTARVDEVRLEA